MPPPIGPSGPKRGSRDNRDNRTPTQGKGLRSYRADRPDRPNRTAPDHALAPEPREPRRALSHAGGRIESYGGDTALRKVAEHALDVTSDETATRRDVHGFHSYPARLHPETAARLIEGLSPPGGNVFDPFCGSGTVLVEARLLGRAAYGIDINPIGVRLARLKSWGASEEFSERLAKAADNVMEISTERRERKAKPTRPYGPEDRALFDPHVLLELDGLRAGIERESQQDVTEVLFLILSSTLTKLSKRQGDSSVRHEQKRHAPGFATRLFGMRTTELMGQLADFRSKLPADALNARIGERDARGPIPWKGTTFDAIVTSPPYPGVYDYLDHHASRLRWLRLDASRFARDEMGARRQLRELSAEDACDQWRRDFGAVLRRMSSVLKPTGHAALVMGDSAIGSIPLIADDMIRELAPKAGLAIVAVASQKRAHFHEDSRRAFGARARREHLIVLGPSK